MISDALSPLEFLNPVLYYTACCIFQTKVTAANCLVLCVFSYFSSIMLRYIYI